jgi:Raf kinase inhibitor-like YbhB/YbcL family protein
MTAIIMTSPAFSEGEFIPPKHTCDGSDVSPALAWAGIPPETKSIALICDDPDAPGGTWVHWVLFNLPATSRGLPEGVPAQRTLTHGGHQGMNDFHKIGYGGPCPPPGTPHRYYFKLYALASVLKLEPGATKAQLVEAMKGLILAEGGLMGRHRR